MYTTSAFQTETTNSHVERLPNSKQYKHLPIQKPPYMDFSRTKAATKKAGPTEHELYGLFPSPYFHSLRTATPTSTRVIKIHRFAFPYWPNHHILNYAHKTLKRDLALRLPHSQCLYRCQKLFKVCYIMPLCYSHLFSQLQISAAIKNHQCISMLSKLSQFGIMCWTRITRHVCENSPCDFRSTSYCAAVKSTED